MDGGGLMFEQGRDVVFLPARITGHAGELPWDVSFVLAATDGVGFEEVTLRRRPDGPSIAADTIRSVPLGAIKEEAVRQAAQHLIKTDEPGTFVPSFDALPIHLEGAFTKRGRRPVTDEVIQEAAKHYEEARRLGRRDHTIYVSEQMHVSRATAARRLKDAREAGYVKEDDR
jgi:hypothetical protein